MFPLMTKILNAFLLTASLLVVISSAAFAQVRPHVIGVRVEANPVEFRGECPATITFTGKIRMSGPGTVRYVWLRSDGARVRPASLKFQAAGEQEVTKTWRLGGPGFPDRVRWQAIRILYPNLVISNHAEFRILCEGPADAGLASASGANGNEYERGGDAAALQGKTETLSGPALVADSGPVFRFSGADHAPAKEARLGLRQGRPREPKPDLVVAMRGPQTAHAGDDIGPLIKIKAHNAGTAVAPGTNGRVDPDHGYVIDLMISTDESLPARPANVSAHFVEDALLRGGRISVTGDLAPGSARLYPVGAEIPADTPTGHYFLCARIDAGNQVAESNERNNTACWPIRVTGRQVENQCRGMLIEKVVPNVIFPGGVIAINGRNFGARQGTKVPAINLGRVNQLQVTSWTDTQITARVPLDLAGGTYRVLIYCDHTHRTSSNSLEVIVRDDIHRPR